MAFTKEGMAAAIKAAQGNSQDQTIQDDALLKMCEGIVNYIKTNMQVTVPAAGLIDAEARPVTGTAIGTVV